MPKTLNPHVCITPQNPLVQAAGAASAVWVLDAIDAKHARQLAEAFAAHPPMRRLSLSKTVVDWPRMEALFHARLRDAEWNAVPSSGWAGTIHLYEPALIACWFCWAALRCTCSVRPCCGAGKQVWWFLSVDVSDTIMLCAAVMLALECAPWHAEAHSFGPNWSWRARASLAKLVTDTALLRAAMMLALECAPPRAKVHLFGFNWSRRAWAAHKMGAEEAFARRLDAAGRIRIHWPACAGMRGCGGCAVRPHFASHLELQPLAGAVQSAAGCVYVFEHVRFEPSPWHSVKNA